jgi:hypothetical protein
MIEMRMRYPGTRAKNTLLVVLLMLVGLFLFTQGTGKIPISLQSIQALEKSVTTSCFENSCQTIICTDDQPCHSFKSNGSPSVIGQPLEDTTTTMQPIEEDNANTVQPPKDNMEIMMLMEKNIVH